MNYWPRTENETLTFFFFGGVCLRECLLWTMWYFFSLANERFCGTCLKLACDLDQFLIDQNKYVVLVLFDYLTIYGTLIHYWLLTFKYICDCQASNFGVCPFLDIFFFFSPSTSLFVQCFYQVEKVSKFKWWRKESSNYKSDSQSIQQSEQTLSFVFYAIYFTSCQYARQSSTFSIVICKELIWCESYNK